MIKFLWAFVLLSYVEYVVSQSLPTVINTNLGKIRGKTGTTSDTGKPILEFLGIPYGKAPLDSNRFLPPEPYGRLVEGDEVFNATKLGNSCIQPSEYYRFDPLKEEVFNSSDSSDGVPFLQFSPSETIGEALGSEDCLVLNVYTRHIPTPENPVSLPVIVFIHGGAFSSGNADLYNGRKFLEHDVVYVSIHYRLGLLGFFSLQTNEIPGNAAMYDMITALLWVQDHISAFGGNPSSVTLTGQSAGSAAVSHLLLSPLSSTPRQLFHRAIALSGSALNTWAVTEEPRRPGLRVSQLAGCYEEKGKSWEEVTEEELSAVGRCMKSVETVKLTDALNAYLNEERKVGRLGFDAVSPVIQTTAPGTMFLSRHPAEILAAGDQLDIPLMQGATRHDGTFPLGVTFNKFLNCPTCGARHTNATFLQQDLISTLLQSMDVQDPTHTIYETLGDRFLHDARFSGDFETMTPGIIDLNSVFFFKAGAYRNLQLHSKKNANSYWYSFDYKGTYSLFPLLFPTPPPFPGGVAHSDDLLYLFHFFTLPTPEDKYVSANFVRYWINFAYNGDPNIYPGDERPPNSTLPLWPKYSDEESEYLVIDKEFSVSSKYMDHWFDVSLELYPGDDDSSTPPPPQLVVDVPTLGKIEGKLFTTLYTRRQSPQFLGIPYGKAPVGENRFLPAEPYGNLTSSESEIFSAKSLGMSCVQPSGIDSKFSSFIDDENLLAILTQNQTAYSEFMENEIKTGYVGEEDCLYLNIFTPKIPVTTSAKELLPVIVFIHGGAFTSGNGDFYTGKKFLEHDVLVVSFNYRLGILGFFCTDTNEAPGNAAMYDIVLALNWVQDHIKYFGGDPDRVTIIGQSAGSVAVSHLMLSELSVSPRPLFHRAISMSGSSMNSWAVGVDPVGAALRVAQLSDCYNPDEDLIDDGTTNLSKVNQCMRNADLGKLVNALMTYQIEERREGRLGFDAVAPVVQKAGTAIKFLAKHPVEILEANEEMDIPYIMGATKHDGTFPLGINYIRFLNCPTCEGRLTNSTFLRNELVPKLLSSMGVNDETQAVYDSLSAQYLIDAKESGSFDLMKPGLIDIHSVFFFKAGAFRNLELHSRLNKDSYWYSFDYKGANSLFSLFFPINNIPPIPAGVAHSDDLLYIFHFFTHPTVEERSVSNNIVNYFVNFAYNGNPNQFPGSGSKPFDYSILPRWPSFNSVDKEYLVINSEFTVQNNYMRSWTNASSELIPGTTPTSQNPIFTTPTQNPNVTTPTTQIPIIVTTPTDNSAQRAYKINRELTLLTLFSTFFILFFEHK